MESSSAYAKYSQAISGWALEGIWEICKFFNSLNKWWHRPIRIISHVSWWHRSIDTKPSQVGRVHRFWSNRIATCKMMCETVTACDPGVHYDRDGISESWIFGTENSRAGARYGREGGRGAVRVAPPCEQPVREVSAARAHHGPSSLDTPPGYSAPEGFHRLAPDTVTVTCRVEYPISWNPLRAYLVL